MSTHVASTLEPASEELAGLGAALEIDASIPSSAVWKVLTHKVLHPDHYLPVTDVITRPSDDGRGTYREMSLGPRRIIENIYCDEAALEVLFVVVDAPTEHVNVITTDAQGKRLLEFYLRDKVSKLRVPWPAPKAVALGGISKVLAAAASASNQ